VSALGSGAHAGAPLSTETFLTSMSATWYQGCGVGTSDPEHGAYPPPRPSATHSDSISRRIFATVKTTPNFICIFVWLGEPGFPGSGPEIFVQGNLSLLNYLIGVVRCSPALGSTAPRSSRDHHTRPPGTYPVCWRACCPGCHLCLGCSALPWTPQRPAPQRAAPRRSRRYWCNQIQPKEVRTCGPLSGGKR
jgi:hypothetical protein